GQMAEALFGPETAAAARWFAKMRRWLRERRQGVAQVARSATQLLDRRKMTKAQRAAFWKAYRYLRRHRRWMDYAGYRRCGLPIGSGVTEAACKTVFTQRFKRSGMRWGHESGQVILDLRVVYLSGLWEEAFACDLAARAVPEPRGVPYRPAPAFAWSYWRIAASPPASTPTTPGSPSSGICTARANPAVTTTPTWICLPPGPSRLGTWRPSSPSWTRASITPTPTC